MTRVTPPLGQSDLTERLMQDAVTALERDEPRLALQLAVTALDTGPRTPTLWLRVDAIRRDALQRLMPTPALQPLQIEASEAVAPPAPVGPVIPDITFAEPTTDRPAAPLYGGAGLQDLYAHPDEDDGMLSVAPVAPPVPALPDPEDLLLVSSPSGGTSAPPPAVPSRGPTGRVLEVAERRGNPERTSPVLVLLTLALLIGAGWWYRQPEQTEQRDALLAFLPASWRDRLTQVGQVGRPTGGVSVRRDLDKAKQQLADGQREEARATAAQVIAADSSTTEGWLVWLEASGWGSADLRVAATGSRSPTVDMAIAERWLTLGDTTAAAAAARAAFTHVASPAQMRRIIAILELVGDTQTIERIRPYVDGPADTTTTP